MALNLRKYKDSPPELLREIEKLRDENDHLYYLLNEWMAEHDNYDWLSDETRKVLDIADNPEGK